MSLATVLSTIETDVVAIVQKAEAAGETWFKSFTPVLESDVEAAWTQFKPVVMGLIVGVEQIGLQALASGTGFDKLAAAAAGLVAAAASQGVTITKSTAATVMQQAVTSIGIPPTTAALKAP